MKKVKRNRQQTKIMNHIILLSAWSFTLVISSFLFLFAGRWVDQRFNTEPTFMLGLFVLGIWICIARMYKDYIKTRDELNTRRVRYQS
ncbi:MAG TPA: AtpZ/AtpI family protein [Deltaproteobacteria bacterium]|nr:AtpZ/AtpI family protein [Deltaproteobacteria bacterium]